MFLSFCVRLSLEGKFEEDKIGLETVEAISKLAEAIDRVDQEMKILKSSLQSSEPISQLESRIKVALERKEEPVLVDADAILATPLKNTTLKSFEDDFPSTPTLEELGLSGPTLSIVGRRVGGFDSSASFSDIEFDNSFYQKYKMRDFILVFDPNLSWCVDPLIALIIHLVPM
jgi:hypothetical protein